MQTVTSEISQLINFHDCFHLFAYLFLHRP